MFQPATLAVLSAFFAAIAIILARTLLKELKTKEMLGINFLTMAAILILLSPLFYRFEATVAAVSVLVLVALIDTAANYFYFKTFERTEASAAAPIISLAPAFTFLFGWMFLDDVVSLRSYILAGIIIAAIVLFSAEKGKLAEFKTNTLAPALMSSLLFGLSAIPSKYLLTTLSAINPPTLYMFRASMIALLALLFFRFNISGVSLRQYRLLAFRSLFVIAQWVLLYYALARANAGIVLTLGNTTPVFVFLLAVIFLKERISTKKLAAAALVLAFSFII